MYKDIKLDRDGHLLWITLNRPDQKNAISDSMIEGIESTLADCTYDKKTRVVIFKANGDFFSSGGDINLMKDKKGMFEGESFELRENYQKGIQRIPLAMEKFPGPIIAMVNGGAIGAGCDLACMADLRVGSENTFFMESFAKLSLVPGDGGTFFLPRIIGYARAMEMFLTCQKIDASKALEWGLLNRLLKSNDLLQETQKMAEQIASLAPVALQMTKRALKMRFHSLSDQLEILSTYQGVAQRLNDHEIGLKALSDKSNPKFQGN